MFQTSIIFWSFSSETPICCNTCSTLDRCSSRFSALESSTCCIHYRYHRLVIFIERYTEILFRHAQHSCIILSYTTSSNSKMGMTGNNKCRVELCMFLFFLSVTVYVIVTPLFYGLVSIHDFSTERLN